MLSTDALNQMAKDFIDIAEEYLNDAGLSLSREITHVISATMGNTWSLPLIHRLFPSAPIIHVKRHPLDTCLACFFKNFQGKAHAYSNDLEDLGFFYLQHQRVVSHWRDVLNIPMLEIFYEELVFNPIATREKICNYIGLNWLVEAASTEDTLKTFSSAHVGHWQNYREQLKPLVTALGKVNEKWLPEMCLGFNRTGVED